MAWTVAGVTLLATAVAVVPLALQRSEAEARMEEARAELRSARARSDRLESRYERARSSRDTDLVHFDRCVSAMNEQIEQHNALIDELERMVPLGPEQAARFAQRFRDMRFTSQTELRNCSLVDPS